MTVKSNAHVNYGPFKKPLWVYDVCISCNFEGDPALEVTLSPGNTVARHFPLPMAAKPEHACYSSRLV
jgi:hypothetical protein